jgi:anti-sigma B factor antagonist
MRVRLWLGKAIRRVHARRDPRDPVTKGVTGMASVTTQVGDRPIQTDPPEQGLDVSVEDRNGSHKIVLAGELDVSTVSRFNNALSEARTQRCHTLIVDLSRLRFMDSTGLSAVLVAEMHARTRNQRFVVVRGPRHVQELFRLTGVDHFLEVVDEPDAADK